MAIVPPWKSPYDSLPVDQEIVWIRVLSMFGQISLAEWNEVDQTFITQDTSIIIPVYMVSRWRDQ